MPLAAGTRLGPYEVVATLGAGGMGEVYRARDTRLGRDVALKVLPAEVADSAERLARFEREARAVAALSHPNVVVLHSIEEANDTRFLTMELIEGRDLSAWVTPGGLAAEALLELAIPLADALAAAHERGIVHRDLKPGNVMVTRERRVKVLDFGLAKLAANEPERLETQAATAASPVSTAGQVVGTVPYMAPEQLRGEAVDARTDLFAFGVLLHELATGSRPFAGSTIADISSAILRDAPPSLSSRRPDLPVALEHIVSRCLEKERSRRPASAASLRDELEAVRRAVGASGQVPARTPASPAAASEPPEAPSIAVLPLENVSRDEENEYFADGLTEELMNLLVRTPGLRVAARTSSFHFKGRQPTLPEVGLALHVAHVLEGSVRRAGDRVRISVRLVKVDDGYPLWSESFERRLDDIFAVQDEVARAVVAALPGDFLPRPASAAAARGTQNREAYDAYLEGRFYWNKRTDADVRRAIQFFERALARDPGFAQAWGGLADCYAVIPYNSLTPAPEVLPRAREAARKALELRPDFGPAHATLAYAQMVDLRWAEAEREFRRAIELSPEDANAHKWYTDLLMMTGRMHAALREVHRALELDPLSASIWTILGEWHWHEGQLDEALADYRKALDLVPTLPLALELAARLCWQRGDFERYFEYRERLEAVSDRVAVPTAELRRAHAQGGREAVLRAQLAAPVARRLATDRARWHAELGDLDAAFLDLDDALAQRELRLAYATYFADFAPLWKDPRFAALLERMGVAMGDPASDRA